MADSAVHNGADFREFDVGGRSKQGLYGGETQPPQTKAARPYNGGTNRSKTPAQAARRYGLSALGFRAEAVVF